MPTLQERRLAPPPSVMLRRAGRVAGPPLPQLALLRLNNTLEGGTNGVNVTPANSGGGSGNAFDTVVSGGSGVTPAYSSTQSAHGGLALKCQTTAVTGTSQVGWTTSLGGALPSLYVRTYVFLTTLPAANDNILRYANGATALCKVQVTTTGVLRLQDAGSTTVFNFATAIAAGQWYRVETFMTFPGYSAATADIRLYTLMDSANIAEEQTASSLNFGTLGLGAVQFGFSNSATSNCIGYWDDMAVSNTAWLGAATQDEMLLSVERQRSYWVPAAAFLRHPRVAPTPAPPQEAQMSPEVPSPAVREEHIKSFAAMQRFDRLIQPAPPQQAQMSPEVPSPAVREERMKSFAAMQRYLRLYAPQPPQEAQMSPAVPSTQIREERLKSFAAAQRDLRLYVPQPPQEAQMSPEVPSAAVRELHMKSFAAMPRYGRINAPLPPQEMQESPEVPSTEVREERLKSFAATQRWSRLVKPTPPQTPALLLLNNLEGGTSGANVTTGNSGGLSGSAFDAITATGSGSTPQYSNSVIGHGSVSLKCVTGATAGTSHVAWLGSLNGPVPFLYTRFNFYLSTMVAATDNIIRFANGGAVLTKLQVTNAGVLRLQDSNLSNVLNFATAIQAATWYRVEMFATFPGNLLGAAIIRLYTVIDSTTITEEQDASGLNFGTLACSGVQFGFSNSATSNCIGYWDDLGVSTTTWLGPATVPEGIVGIERPRSYWVPAAAFIRRARSLHQAPPIVYSIGVKQQSPVAPRHRVPIALPRWDRNNAPQPPQLAQQSPEVPSTEVLRERLKSFAATQHWDRVNAPLPPQLAQMSPEVPSTNQHPLRIKSLAATQRWLRRVQPAPPLNIEIEQHSPETPRRIPQWLIIGRRLRNVTPNVANPPLPAQNPETARRIPQWVLPSRRVREHNYVTSVPILPAQMPITARRTPQWVVATRKVRNRVIVPPQVLPPAPPRAYAVAGNVRKLLRRITPRVGRVLLPWRGFLVRPPLNLGGSEVDQNTFGGTAVDIAEGVLGGQATDANIFAGTVVNDVYGGTGTGWTMQEVDITLAQFNDETLAVTITSGGSAFNITGLELDVFLKTAAGIPDTDSSTVKLSTVSGDIAITNGPGGLANVAIPAMDLQGVGIAFWRLDIIQSGKRNTALYGSVSIRKL